MKDSEIDKILARHPNRMRILCRACGDYYGNHVGFNCPDGVHRFDPLIDEEIDKSNPNSIFKYKYK